MLHSWFLSCGSGSSSSWGKLKHFQSMCNRMSVRRFCWQKSSLVSWVSPLFGGTSLGSPQWCPGVCTTQQSPPLNQGSLSLVSLLYYYYIIIIIINFRLEVSHHSTHCCRASSWCSWTGETGEWYLQQISPDDNWVVIWWQCWCGPVLIGGLEVLEDGIIYTSASSIYKLE